MSAQQYDLFGELEAAEANKALWAQPTTCPACGITEPNGYLADISHGAAPDEDGICGYPPGEHPIYGDMCVAQYLVRNHITYAVRNGLDATRDMARGRELGLDVDAIAAEAVTP